MTFYASRLVQDAVVRNLQTLATQPCHRLGVPIMHHRPQIVRVHLPVYRAGSALAAWVLAVLDKPRMTRKY